MNKSVQAQGLYLANLLALPGLSFLLLVYLHHKLVRIYSNPAIRDALDLEMDLDLDNCKDIQQRRAIEASISQDELDISHSRAAFWLTIIGGTLVIGGCSLIYFVMNSAPQTWPMIIVYFTIMHTTFVMWGMVNLARYVFSFAFL